MNIEKKTFSNYAANCKECKIFFASQAYQGYCSSCFKQNRFYARKQENYVQQTLEKKSESPISSQITSPFKEELPKGEEPIVKLQKRCCDCKRKLGNLGTECKCGSIFCNLHRLPENHKCTFNFQAQATKKLQEKLLKVTNLKIDKIV